MPWGAWTSSWIAKREARVSRKGIVVEYAVKWDEWDQTPDMTWEPPENLSNAKEEVVKFERRVAAMPSRDAFSRPTALSACCYATCCKVADRADVETSQCFVCAKTVHPACATQHLFLEPFIRKLDSANICFDCALLVAMVEKRTPFGIPGARLMFEPYYLQLRGVAALTEPSPFALGAFIATGALKLLEAATTTARSATAGAKCAKCKSAAGELRACSFCKAGIYHDTPACIGEQRGPEASFKHKSFPWCCPKCFRKGKAALSKHLAAPAPAPTKKRSRR